MSKTDHTPHRGAPRARHRCVHHTLRVAAAVALAHTLHAPGPLAAQATRATAPPGHHYEIRATLDPSREHMEVTATLHFMAASPGVHALEYLLNTSLELEGVEASVPIARLVRDTTRRGEHRTQQMGEPIRLELERPLEAGERVRVTMRYHGGITTDQWGTNVLGPEWFELAQYAPWFPYVPGDRSITYVLEVDVPPDHRLAALGRVTRSGDRYHVVQDEPVNDIVIAGGPALRADTVQRGGLKVVLGHAGLRATQLESIGKDVEQAVDAFGGWIGSAPFSELEFLFSPRTSGGGYARPGFVVMQVSADDAVDTPSFLRYLGHEVAHLWWARAPTDGWEDWLNESWAEYTALMLLRERFGEDEMDERIVQYRRAADDVPPIRGIPRDHPMAFEALYRKGPVILHELELRVGRARFLDLMRAVASAGVESTDRLLEIVAEVTSAEHRDWLAEALER